MTFGIHYLFFALKKCQDPNSTVLLRAIFRLSYLIPVPFTSPYHSSHENCDRNIRCGIHLYLDALNKMGSKLKNVFTI